jgi:hypothetical protein
MMKVTKEDTRLSVEKVKTDLKKVDYKSSPRGATVYAIPLIHFDRNPDLDVLLANSLPIPEGPSNEATKLSSMMEYRFVFVLKDKKPEVRPCIPGIHDSVSVNFP